MVGIEFYTYDDELWCKTRDGKSFIVDETKTDVVSYILNNVRAMYPEAYSALEQLYSKSSLNVPYYRYLMARRFCKCNFSNLDTTMEDIDDENVDAVFHFEKVSCPMRGECSHEGIICCPKFNSSLSKAEKRVMKLWYKGLPKEEIGRILFLSPGTVKNHIKSAYVKLGVHSSAEFVRYANEHQLFTN